jgi:hypothetical protein
MALIPLLDDPSRIAAAFDIAETIPGLVAICKG